MIVRHKYNIFERESQRWETRQANKYEDERDVRDNKTILMSQYEE